MTDLERRRLELGLSVAAAAARIGVHRRTLARAEMGLPVQPAKALLISKFYGLDTSGLLGLLSTPEAAERAA